MRIRLDALVPAGDHYRVIGYAVPTDDDRGLGVVLNEIPKADEDGKRRFLILQPGWQQERFEVPGTRVKDDRIIY